MKKYIVTATAPTVYQRTSVGYFGSEVTAMRSGAFVFTKEFETEQDAKDYLCSRAENYFETQEEIEQAANEIERCGSIQFDAVRGYIEEINE